MVEKIYTIPINEAFDRAPTGAPPDCPFCLLQKMLEANEIERILGAAMMEPDVRIETNRLGFCRKHFDMMMEKGNRLGLALILESHIASVQNEIFSGGTLFDAAGNREEEKLKKLDESCYICKRTDDAINKMFGNAAFLWDTEEDFRAKFKTQKFFCLPHYRRLLSVGRAELSKKQFRDLFDVSRKIMQAYIAELGGDVSWFCKKFDYRYDGEPWYNSKDSTSRAINFLSGGTNENDNK